MTKVSKLLKLDYHRQYSKGDKKNNIALEMININNNPLENEVKINQFNHPFENEVKIEQTNNPLDNQVRKYQTNIPHENDVRIDQKDSGINEDKASIVPIKFL